MSRRPPRSHRGRRSHAGDDAATRSRSARDAGRARHYWPTVQIRLLTGSQLHDRFVWGAQSALTRWYIGLHRRDQHRGTGQHQYDRASEWRRRGAPGHPADRARRRARSHRRERVNGPRSRPARDAAHAGGGERSLGGAAARRVAHSATNAPSAPCGRMRRNRLSWRGWVCGPFANITQDPGESVVAIRETMHADHCEIFELSGDARVLVLRAGTLAFGQPRRRVRRRGDTVPGRAVLTYLGRGEGAAPRFPILAAFRAGTNGRVKRG